MSDSHKNSIYLSSSPHFSRGLSTRGIMLAVIIALLPEFVYGVILFGIKALVNVLVSVASAVAFEALFQFLCRKKVSVDDCSAVVTGLLLGLSCPASVPVWMIILGAMVAVVVAKGLFGGLGANVFNPALIGRAFLFVSFPTVMGAQWIVPAISSVDAADAVSSATVMSRVSSGALSVTPDVVKEFFFGRMAGCIGETSVILILLSFIFLLVIGVIDWRAPAAMAGTVAAGSFILALVKTGSCSDAFIKMLSEICAGGLMFGAVFMITDYSTAPVTKPGRLVFGFGAGLITFLIRNFGGYPEGVMFSILIMNAVAPFLNNLTCRKYGYGKKASARPAAKKIVQEFDVKNARTEVTK